MSEWNFADVWETVAEVQPDAPALVHGRPHPDLARVRPPGGQRRPLAARRRGRPAGQGRPLPLQLPRVPRGQLRRLQDRSRARSTPTTATPTTSSSTCGRTPTPWPWSSTVPSSTASRGSATGCPAVRSWLWVDDGTATCPPWAVPYEEAAETTGRSDGGDGHRRVGHRGAGAPTTCTCSTRAAPPACPRGSCGARTTSSPASTAGGSAATRSRAASTTCAPSCRPTAPA